jgi:hypothetical protein
LTAVEKEAFNASFLDFFGCFEQARRLSTGEVDAQSSPVGFCFFVAGNKVPSSLLVSNCCTSGYGHAAGETGRGSWRDGVSLLGRKAELRWTTVETVTKWTLDFTLRFLV